MQRQNSGGWGKLYRYSFLLVVLIIVSLAPAPGESAASTQTSKPLPVFEIDQTEHNFGEVFIGEDLSCVFNVRNLGAAPLELSETPIITTGPRVGSYRPPSGLSDDDNKLAGRLQLVGLKRAAAPTWCLARDFYFDKVIQPGQAGIVRITIRSINEVGPYVGDFTLYTNDPRRSTVKLKVRATTRVVPEPAKRLRKTNLTQGETVGSFNVWPGSTPSVALERNESFRASFRIRPTFKEAFELQVKSAPAKGARVTVRREEPGSGYWLDIEAEPAAEAGQRNFTVELQSKGIREESLTVVLSVQVLGDALVFTPEVIDCGEIPLSSLKQFPTRVGRVSLRKLVGTFKIKSLSSTLSFLQTEAQTIVDGSNYLIKVNSQPGNLPAAGSYTGKLIVETDDAKQPHVEIPLKIVVTDK